MKLSALVFITVMVSGCVPLRVKTVPVVKQERIKRTFVRRVNSVTIDNQILRVSVAEQRVQEIIEGQTDKEVLDTTRDDEPTTERIVSTRPYGGSITVTSAYSTHSFVVPGTGELGLSLPETPEQLSIYSPALVVEFDDGNYTQLDIEITDATKNALARRLREAGSLKKIMAIKDSFPKKEGFDLTAGRVFSEVSVEIERETEFKKLAAKGDTAYQKKKYGEALRQWRKLRGGDFDEEVNARMSLLRGYVAAIDLGSWDEATFFFQEEVGVTALYNPARYQARTIKFSATVIKLLSDDELLVDVGRTTVYVACQRPFPFPKGAPVEVLGLVSGTQQLQTVFGGTTTAPKVVGIWVRSLIP